MPTANIPSGSIARKTRRRLSRYGCRNCKLRKVKCDEEKPQCEKCRRHGIRCNFEARIPNLHSIHQSIEHSSRRVPHLSNAVVLRPAISSAIWSCDDETNFQLDAQDRNLFCRFRQQTMPSLGGVEVRYVYENKLLANSFTCPALMHGMLALSATHSRHLNPDSSSRRSLKEVCHAYSSTVHYRSLLTKPISESHKDTIWATAVLLTTLAFATVDISSPHKAWPMKATDSTDLQWLQFKASDKVLWPLVSPMRRSSIFSVLAETFSSISQQRLPEEGTDGVPRELVSLCELHELSSSENNIYFTFVHKLSRLLECKPTDVSFYQAFAAISSTSEAFRVRLEAKHPAALALLYLWYTTISMSRWWITLRTQFEMPAIYTYLQRHHKDVVSTIDKLASPPAISGLKQRAIEA